MGSSNGRLVWIGIAALVVAAVLGAVAFLGLPRPVLSREAVAAVALLSAFVAWSGLSVLWSIEPDRSWDYFNRGLVYLALAIVGVAIGSLVPRSARAWAYVLAVALALPLGWALLTKAVPAIGSDTGRVARLSAPVGYWNSLGCSSRWPCRWRCGSRPGGSTRTGSGRSGWSMRTRCWSRCC